MPEKTPDVPAPAPAQRKEEPEPALEADIPTDDGQVEDDLTIERDDLPPRQPSRE
jgi:hypothetical protein